MNFFEIQAGLLFFVAKQIRNSIRSDAMKLFIHILWWRRDEVGFVEKLKDILMPMEDVME